MHVFDNEVSRGPKVTVTTCVKVTLTLSAITAKLHTALFNRRKQHVIHDTCRDIVVFLLSKLGLRSDLGLA